MTEILDIYTVALTIAVWVSPLAVFVIAFIARSR